MFFKVFCCCFCLFFALTVASNEPSVLSNEFLSQRIKKKQICVFYGNCQMGAVSDYLKKNYSDGLDCTYIINYHTIYDKALLPIELLKQADIFVYQPLKGYGEVDTKYIVNHYLKKECKTLSFAYLYFGGYFPDSIPDPQNAKTISPEYPFGIFASGHSIIMDLIAKGVSVSHMIEASFKPDLFDEASVLKNVQKTLTILEKREKKTDIKLANYIWKNFRKWRLFHTANHPTNHLLKALIKQIVAKLKLPKRSFDADPFFDSERLEFHTVSIIYPSVAAILQLEFDSSHARSRYEDISMSEYIDDYIRTLYPDYYFSFENSISFP